jgi:hypothetical protein
MTTAAVTIAEIYRDDEMDVNQLCNPPIVHLFQSSSGGGWKIDLTLHRPIF